MTTSALTTVAADFPLPLLWDCQENDPPYNFYRMSTVRWTLSKLRQGKTRADLQAAIQELIPTHYPYVICRERGQARSCNMHVHCYFWCTDLQPFRELLQEYMLKERSAWQSKYYMTNQDMEKDEETAKKSPEYFLGYGFKDWDILSTNINESQQQQFFNLYKQSNIKTTDDMLIYVMQHYPNPTIYDTEVLLDTILDYHKHSNKVYDYSTIVKREFHLCRLKMFETVEREYMRKHKGNLLGLL